jgi:hypothetical protein
VAVGAADIAECDLLLEARPRHPEDHAGDDASLELTVAVIEVEDSQVLLTAVDAWVRLEMADQSPTILLRPQTVPPLNLANVLLAVLQVPLVPAPATTVLAAVAGVLPSAEGLQRKGASAGAARLGVGHGA